MNEGKENLRFMLMDILMKLPESDFPLKAESMDAETGESLWEIEITGPGYIELPDKPPHVGRTKMKVTFANGEVTCSD